MIFIDWISTEHHRGFNRAFFAAVGIARPRVYLFNEALAIPEHENFVGRKTSSRWYRACQVLKLCLQHRTETILFLSYDALFIPLVRLIAKKVVVFEHNTTPERIGFSKHCIWQWLTFRGILRLTQYPTQTKILKALGQEVNYVGSPLEDSREHIGVSEPPVLLAPSFRLNMEELARVADVLRSFPVIIKSNMLSREAHLKLTGKVDLRPVDWIDIERLLPSLVGIVVSVKSLSRGSGWFNDAIRFGIPILITDKDMGALFELTFPGYPYVRLWDPEHQSRFKELLVTLRKFPASSYIAQSNEALRQRFEEGLVKNGLGPGM